MEKTIEHLLHILVVVVLIRVITGTAAAFIGVTETTGRGSLYFHVAIWGGLSPDLLQNISGY